MQSDTRPRIVVAGFQHETNTFSPAGTTYEDFVLGGGWLPMTRGRDLLDAFPSLNIPLAGFIRAATEDAGSSPAALIPATLIPVLWASAEPANTVETAAFERICDLILDAIRQAGEIDGVYLDLHGAMVTAAHEDGEGEILRRVRAAVGPGCPIVASFDLHANLSPDAAAIADALTIYRTYPHLDMDETGARAWRLLRWMLASGGRPARAYRQAQVVIPLSAQCTDFGPLRALYSRLEESAPGLLSADIALGFPPADIRDMGPAVVAYAQSQAVADEAARAFCAELEAAAEALDNTLLSPAEAVRQALAMTEDGGAVVLADVQDNSGAGALSDTTGLLAALAAAGAAPAVLGALWDPAAAESAHAAGTGARLDLELGGRHGPDGVAPFPCVATVEALSDGRFICTGAMQRDVETDIGPSALLRVEGGPQVLVSSRRHQIIDQQAFRHIGVDLAAQRVIAVKSTVHFRADFTPLAKAVLMVDAPGYNPCHPERLPYRNLRPGLRFAGAVGAAAAARG